MADRIFHNMQSYSRGTIYLAGAFRPNGSSAVDNDLNKGHGFTVARSATGVYDVTIEDSFTDFVSIMCNLSHATLADEYVRPGTIDIANNTFEILAHDGATPAALDIASDVDTFIHFLAILKNTSVNR